MMENLEITVDRENKESLYVMDKYVHFTDIYIILCNFAGYAWRPR